MESNSNGASGTIPSAFQLVRSQAFTLPLEDVRNADITEEVALRHHERFTELKMRLLGE